ncbi:MAG: hypothetical protein PHQ43_14795, partial [Dehalococcoidales bacterium]|nr:hypothetical protein [Dehalococcoidales bacterium]
NLEAHFDPESHTFSVTVVNCGVDALLAGRVYTGMECNFPFLAAEVFPDTDADYWGYDEYVAALGG